MENKIVPCEIPSEIPMEEREQVRLVERFLCTGGFPSLAACSQVCLTTSCLQRMGFDSCKCSPVNSDCSSFSVVCVKEHLKRLKI